MANTEEKQEFNYFDFFKFQVLKTYYENLLAGKKTDELEVKMKFFDNQKSTYFYKVGAMKFVEWKTEIDEYGRVQTIVKIKDLNIGAKAKSKAGKEYNVFNSFDIAKAIKSVTKALV
jgi:hypothetical protein